jgi:cold shock protein
VPCRKSGRCKSFNRERGFGFIRRQDGTDLFVHVSQTGQILLEHGERVSFEVGQNSRTNKPEAKNVAILDMEGVRGSIPLPPTSQNQPLLALFDA